MNQRFWSLQCGSIDARRFGLRHAAARRSFEHPFRGFQAAFRLARRFRAPENPRASSLNNLMHEDGSTEPRVPAIRDLPLFGPVRFMSSSFTMRGTGA